ncbi:MAG TPA: PsiF family protein [Methylocystis sp.]|nr:PsiF family protein [Methylocystis sp.]
MKTFFVALLATFAISCAHAQETSDCAAKAAEKKLAGAALKSFVTKCEKDSCNAAATDKKLAGAARKSFVTKCVKDAAAH